MLHSTTVLLSYGISCNKRTQKLKSYGTSVMVDVYELFGKHVASLRLTSSWLSLVLTLYVVTAATSGGVHQHVRVALSEIV